MIRPERKLVVVGAGRLAMNLIDLYNLENRLQYIHDTPYHEGEKKFGVPVQIFNPMRDCDYVSCIGDPRDKREKLRIFELAHVQFVNFIHPTTTISKTCEKGVDVTTQANSMIYNKTRIGNHVHIAGAVCMAHDSEVGDYCTLSHHVFLGGHVKVGAGTWLGADCLVKPKITIGEGCLIGMGAKIVKDVPDNTIIWEDTKWRTEKQKTPWSK